MAGERRRVTMSSCRAAEHLYAMSWMDAKTPAEVDALLRQLTQVALTNVGAAERDAKALPFNVHGATPQAASGRWQWTGRLPDGREVQQQGAVFARGLRVYQASVVASAIGAVRADTFFASLRWRA